MSLRIGLNPYGLTYTLGLQGLGTARANPKGIGLDGFLDLAAAHRAQVLELDWRWLLPLNNDRRREVARRALAADQVVIVSAWLRHESTETLAGVFAVARALGAALVRLHLTPVLEGGRAALGDRWPTMVAHARATLIREAARARTMGLALGIENHQDLGSEELLALCAEAGDHVGIVFDTGNPFAVGEDPIAFAKRVAPRVVHMHLKDYRAQFTDEGYRLVRCAIGEGCVPLPALADMVATDREVTASIEPAALEARHIRLFTSDWWKGYPPRDADELAVALGRLRHRRHPDADDVSTPWERQAPSEDIVAYELEQLNRSFEFAARLVP